MSIKISTLFSRLCAAGVAILGFGCSSADDPDELICMYGTVTGSFEIKGKVTTEDGKNVSDAAVKVTRQDVPSGIYS